MHEWLERELTEQLRPVEAPEELWERVQERFGGPRRQVRWMALAAGLALMTAGTLWLSARVPSARGIPRPLASADPGTCLLCHTHL
jgi:hypothetical protein